MSPICRCETSLVLTKPPRCLNVNPLQVAYRTHGTHVTDMGLTRKLIQLIMVQKSALKINLKKILEHGFENDVLPQERAMSTGKF